jgi:hypothetical protein
MKKRFYFGIWEKNTMLRQRAWLCGKKPKKNPDRASSPVRVIFRR